MRELAGYAHLRLTGLMTVPRATDDPERTVEHLKRHLKPGGRLMLFVYAHEGTWLVRALVERLPVLICPKWVAVCAQPIGIEDLIAYLVGALDLPEDRVGIFPIGGPDVVSYGEIMREYVA